MLKSLLVSRSMEGSVPTYHHDRYPHGSAMVHLRRSQGHPQPPPSSPTRNARVPQEEVGGQTSVNGPVLNSLQSPKHIALTLAFSEFFLY